MTKNNLLILTALKAEATPFIQHYKLRKKKLIDDKFIYHRETITLLITGIGKTNVQRTIRNYCNQYKIKQHVFVVNIGSAGGNPDLYKIGDLFFINKITDEMDIATYYPNILFKHGMNESSLTTVKYPVVDGHGTYDGLVDMEASEIWNIFRTMIPNHRLIFLKVTSDYMDNKYLNFKTFEKLATDILTNQLTPITNFLYILQEIKLNDNTTVGENEK